MSDTQFCNACKCNKLPTEFISNNGNVYKTCNKCRERRSIKSPKKEEVTRQNGESLEKQCSNCKCFKTIEHFIKPNGNYYKTCNKCRK